MLRVATIFRAAIRQHAAELHLIGIVERHDAIADEIRRTKSSSDR
jgi:hypothetical protein